MFGLIYQAARYGDANQTQPHILIFRTWTLHSDGSRTGHYDIAR